jgi:hypothetical protein
VLVQPFIQWVVCLMRGPFAFSLGMRFSELIDVDVVISDAADVRHG